MQTAVPVDLARVRRDSRRLLRLLPTLPRPARLPALRIRPPLALSVAFPTPKYIRRQNRTTRGVNASTDVLAFPFPYRGVRFGGRQELGDILIDAAIADRDRAEHPALPSLADHIARLEIHGLLHLVGFDHHTDEDNDEMVALEASLLERVLSAEASYAARRPRAPPERPPPGGESEQQREELGAGAHADGQP